LKLVAHRPEVALERRDCGFVEVGSPIEGRRAIVGKKLARELAMDGFRKNPGSAEIGPRRLPPQHVGAMRKGQAALDAMSKPGARLQLIKPLGRAFAGEEFPIALVDVGGD